MPSRQRQHLASIVGANIAALRTQRGWNQTQLAERLGMGPDSLSRMERGLVAPRFARLERIAEALACSVAELFFTAEDRARMTPAACVQDANPNDKSATGRPTCRLAENVAPFGEAEQAIVRVAPRLRHYDNGAVEEAIFMAERIAALLRQ